MLAEASAGETVIRCFLEPGWPVVPMGKRYQRNEGASDRQADLDLTHDVAAKARATEGCLDFAQSADPLESTRINLFERWISE